MGHIKTNKTLYLTEILTLLKSTFNQQKNQVERLFRFSKTTARILRPTLSNLFATPSENHIVWANLSCYSVNKFSKNRRGTTRACIELSRAVYSNYCLTKISIRTKRSISGVFSLFIVPSPFFVHCPYKGRINRAESVLTGLKAY